MKIENRKTIQVGSYCVNCTVVESGGEAWIVDPGSEAERIAAICEAAGAVPKGILLTHAHFDHVGAVEGLQKAYPGLAVYLGKADFPVISHPFNQMPPEYPPVPVPANLVAAEELQGVRVIPTPGHTPGGVVLWERREGIAFSGDTLFRMSVGRTDLPGGDYEQLLQSLNNIALTLPPDTRIYPGHGPATNMSDELRCNPYLSGN